MKLSIILVSFNTKDLIKQALESLPDISEVEVIVIDNASTDGTAQLIKQEFPGIKLIRNKNNTGFAKANNQGIKAAKGELLLLLNSDTKAQGDAIKTLIQFMEDNPDAGILSCQLLNPDSSLQPQGGYLPNILNISFWMLFIDDLPFIGKYLYPYQLRYRGVFKKRRELGWVGGTAMLIRRNVIDEIGLLDENIFMYGEDVDFCLRARAKGIKVSYTPNARIFHYGQQSSGGKASIAILGEYQALKYIFKKHKSKPEYLILRLLLKIGSLLRMFIFGILQGRERYEIYKKAFHLA